MLFKNFNLWKLLLFLSATLCTYVVYYHYKTNYQSAFYNFSEYIKAKYSDCEISINNTHLIIKTNTNGDNLLKMLLRLNVKIDYFYYKDNQLILYCIPEGFSPKFVFNLPNIVEKPVVSEPKQPIIPKQIVKRKKRCKVQYQ